MTYDEFADKLRKIKLEFQKSRKRPLNTIEDLEDYLDKRLAKPKKVGARSLRGLSL